MTYIPSAPMAPPATHLPSTPPTVPQPGPPGGSQFELRVGPDTDPDRYGYGQIRGSGAEGELHHGVQFSDLVGSDLEVAIKEAKGDEAGLTTLAARWADQAAVLNRIAHPGIVRVHAAFLGAPAHWAGTPPSPGRRFYLIMNWVNGENLRVWREAQPHLSPRQSLGPLVQVASALDVLHSGADTGRPLVHGDLKPENVVMHPANGPVLVDFGLLRAEGRQLPSMAGSGGYRAPEVLDYGRWSPASDRYALAAVGYFLLTGTDLEERPNLQVVRDRLLALPQLAGQFGVVDSLLAMLHPDPAARPPIATPWVQAMIGTMSTTMGQTVITSTMAQPVDPLVPVMPIATPKRARRWPIVAAIAAAVLLIGGVAGAVALTGGDDPQPGPIADGTSTTTSSSTSPSSSTSSSSSSTSSTSSSTTPSSTAPTSTIPGSSENGDYLNDLKVVEGTDPDTEGNIRINGQTFVRAVNSQLCPTNSYSSNYRSFSWSYDLARSRASFTGVLGLTDDSPAGAQVQVRISLDGVEQEPISLTLGMAKVLDMDVTGKLRLTIDAARLDQPPSKSCAPEAHVAIGDGKLK